MIFRRVTRPGYVVRDDVSSDARFYESFFDLGVDYVGFEFFFNLSVNASEVPANGLTKLVDNGVGDVDGRSERHLVLAPNELIELLGDPVPLERIHVSVAPAFAEFVGTATPPH